MALAAEAAGMTNVRIISEPAAIALAFGREGRFLILDFGANAGISVVEGEGRVWQILESVENVKIGGRYFDFTLAEWLRERLQFNHIPEDAPCWRVLVQEAETIKIALSSCLAYDWKLHSLDNREFPPLRVEREELERMTRFSIKRLTNMLSRLWGKHQPERLLLAGGSSRIPLLMYLLELEREIPRPERLNLCAEEFVAIGAALYASANQEQFLSESAEPLLATAGSQRVRDLKMRLVLVEPSLNQAQRERLHFMVDKLENLEDDAESIEILEGIVKDLEAEFFKKKSAS